MGCGGAAGRLRGDDVIGLRGERERNPDSAGYRIHSRFLAFICVVRIKKTRPRDSPRDMRLPLSSAL